MAGCMEQNVVFGEEDSQDCGGGKYGDYLFLALGFHFGSKKNTPKESPKWKTLPIVTGLRDLGILVIVGAATWGRKMKAI